MESNGHLCEDLGACHYSASKCNEVSMEQIRALGVIFTGNAATPTHVATGLCTARNCFCRAMDITIWDRPSVADLRA